MTNTSLHTAAIDGKGESTIESRSFGSASVYELLAQLCALGRGSAGAMVLVTLAVAAVVGYFIAVALGVSAAFVALGYPLGVTGAVMAGMLSIGAAKALFARGSTWAQKKLEAYMANDPALTAQYDSYIKGQHVPMHDQAEK